MESGILTRLNRELQEVTDLAYFKKLDDYEFTLYFNDITKSIALAKGDLSMLSNTERNMREDPS